MDLELYIFSFAWGGGAEVGCVGWGVAKSDVSGEMEVFMARGVLAVRPPWLLVRESGVRVPASGPLRSAPRWSRAARPPAGPLM